MKFDKFFQSMQKKKRTLDRYEAHIKKTDKSKQAHLAELKKKQERHFSIKRQTIIDRIEGKM